MTLGRLRRCESGSSLLEFAIVLPVLLVLLIGLIDLGRAAYFGILTANAARAGAQYGAQSIYTSTDTTGMSSAAIADAPGIGLTAVGSTLCSINGGALTTCPSNINGQTVVYYVKVHASGTFASLVRYPGLPPQISISGDSVVRVVAQ
jgi:Flp pilus assembly protein TadG